MAKESDSFRGTEKNEELTSKQIINEATVSIVSKSMVGTARTIIAWFRITLIATQFETISKNLN